MHPDHRHQTAFGDDPDAALERRVEIARQSGVPPGPLAAYGEAARTRNSGIKALVLPDKELVAGVRVTTDLGVWEVHETPGHAPSHVSLHQPERRLLISGDHLLGRVSIYYEHGWSPDPVAEFLTSLDVVERLDARLCLSGHGRTFTDVQAHIEANRRLVAQSVARHLEVLADGERTVFEVVAQVQGEPVTAVNANWWLSESLCYVEHLEATGRARRVEQDDDGTQRWTAL